MKWVLIIQDGTDPKLLFDKIMENKNNFDTENIVLPIKYDEDTVTVETNAKVQILTNSIYRLLEVEVIV